MSSWSSTDWNSGGWWGESNGTSPEKWSSWRSAGSTWPDWSSTASTSTPSASSSVQKQDAEWASTRGREAATQQGSAKRAQSSPPTPAVPSRQDKWWLGVDAETRKKYAEEMRKWLSGIDSSLTQYFSTIEDNYDTVDQICRLYAVDSEKPKPALKGKFLDPLFFDDNNISDPDHRRLFKKWFAERIGVDFVDDEPRSVTTTVAEATKLDSIELAAVSTSEVRADAVPSPEKSWGTSSPEKSWGYGVWSGDSWSGSWWEGDSGRERIAASEKMPASTTWSWSGYSDWSSSDKWK